MNLAFLLAQRVKYWREKYKGRRWMLRSVSPGRKPLGYGGGQCPGTGFAGGRCRNSPQFLMALQINSCSSWQKDSSHQKPGSSAVHWWASLTLWWEEEGAIQCIVLFTLFCLKMRKYCDSLMQLENRLQKFTVLKCRKEYITLSLACTQ